MTNKETITRNIGLTFDFVNHLAENPSLIETLPDKFKLNFVESDFTITAHPEPSRKNKRIKEKFVKVRNTFDFAFNGGNIREM
jgi:hypothetical protein